MKLSAILWGIIMMVPFALIAQAQGVGDAERRCSLNPRSAIASRPERTWLARAYMASSGAKPAAYLDSRIRRR